MSRPGSNPAPSTTTKPAPPPNPPPAPGLHPVTPEPGKFHELRIEQLQASRTNPRKHFDEAFLAELAASIKQHGIVQPIVARPKGDAFEIVAGEQRWRAAQMAGVPTVPAIVRELTDTQVIEVQIIENLQRKNVHPLEEASGFSRLMDKTLMGANALTAEQIGERIGKSKEYVYARLQLLKLGDRAREKFEQGGLPTEHAVLLARLAEGDQSRALAECKKYVDGYPPVKVFREYIEKEIKQANARQAIADAKAAAKKDGHRSALISTYEHAEPGMPPTVLLSGRYKIVSEKKVWLDDGTISCTNLAVGIYVDQHRAGATDWVCTERGCAIHWKTTADAKPKAAKKAKTSAKAKAEDDKHKAEEEAARKRLALQEEAEGLSQARAIAQALKNFEKKPTLTIGDLQHLAACLLDSTIGCVEHTEVVREHFRLPKTGSAVYEIPKAIGKAKNIAEATALLMAAMILAAVENAHYDTAQFPDLLKRRGVDLKQIEKDTLAELQAKEKPAAQPPKAKEKKAAPAKKAKKAKGKK